MSKILQTKDIESPPLPGEHRRLVQRIAESSHFRKSPRLREFLFFIVERYMEGRAHELTEQDIGCRVFERPLGYKPSEDNIVRVSVRQLRSKLKDYFDAEGLEEEFTLEVPRGGYVPVFKPVEHVGTERGRTWPIRVAAAASVFALVALAVALWFWRENRTLKAAGAAPSVPTLVSELLLKSNQPVTIVLSDFALVLMQNLSGGRDVPLEDYAKRSYLAEPSDLKEQPILSLWRTLATRQITSVDNVTLVSRLLKAHPDHRDQVSIRHARSMDIRDFKTGSFIIQGGSISTPWAALFERQLNFRTEKSKSGLVMRNVRPQPGEPAQYGPAVSGANGKTSYARLDFVPNLSGTGKILLVAGFDMAASEAAAEFVLSPASVSLVQHALAQSDLSKIGHFELVLETSALDGTGNGARIVAFRR